jgi:hypothetical protein
MKMIGTLFTTPAILGLCFAAIALRTISHQGYGVLQWCVAILAVLLTAFLIGTLLNFAVFAPVYWLLGRSRSKKFQKGTGHDDHA